MVGLAGTMALLEAVFDTIPSMVFVKRASDRTYVRVNQAGQRFAGKSEAELIGKTVFDALPPDVAVVVDEMERGVLRTGEGAEVDDLRVETPAGVTWLWVQFVPILGPNGTPEFVLAIARDVTENHELQRINHTWKLAFDNAEWGVAIVSADGRRFDDVNPAFCRMHGYTREELIGASRLSVVAPEAREETERMLVLVKDRGHYAFESIHQRKDGSTFPVAIDAGIARDLEGNPMFRAVNVQDVSVLKLTEQGLRTAREEAERANQAKSEFLSRMSHELRTPLNVILGFSQVLQMDHLSEDQAESVDHILRAGRHLLALIDDVLDISRIESGKVALSIEPVDASAVFAEVFRLMEPAAARSRVQLLRGNGHNQCYVLADRKRLTQVLMNIVSNAIKYNVEGGFVRIECVEGDSLVEFSISDSGIGIPAGDLERLFAPFDRLGMEASGIEGTGLGLSLCRSLIEAMDGAITAARNPDRGSTFTVTLKKAESPVVEAARTAILAPDPAASAVAGAILCIEDNLANFKVIQHILAHRQNIVVIPAMQGEIGLQLARDHRPGLILLDLHLPDIPGEEVLQRLLHNPATSDIPVVIVSADATPRRVERLLQIGARGYLTKPIDVPKLLETVDQLLGGISRRNAGPP
jgi:PAS domain S-box-containing protein